MELSFSKAVPNKKFRLDSQFFGGNKPIGKITGGLVCEPA